MSISQNYVDDIKPIEMPVAVKGIVPGYTIAFLENGDAFLIQFVADNVRIVLGQKDANGNPVYNFEIKQSVTVISSGK